MASKALVLDANILIRAVLGQCVRRILESYAESVSFFLPETAYLEAEEHLAELVVKRGGDPAKALALLRSLANLGNYSAWTSMAAMSRKLGNASTRATLTTGLFWRPHWLGVSDLDLRHRLLRVWRRDLDIQQYRHVPG
jgi:hypothetical protein